MLLTIQTLCSGFVDTYVYITMVVTWLSRSSSRSQAPWVFIPGSTTTAHFLYLSSNIPAISYQIYMGLYIMRWMSFRQGANSLDQSFVPTFVLFLLMLALVMFALLYLLEHILKNIALRMVVPAYVGIVWISTVLLYFLTMRRLRDRALSNAAPNDLVKSRLLYLAGCFLTPYGFQSLVSHEAHRLMCSYKN